MSVLDFPNNPVDGEQYIFGDIIFEWSDSKDAWFVTGGSGGPIPQVGAFFENDTVVSSSYTITSGKNAGSFGPIEIASGVTVTVPAGSVWSVV
jgi:hypothetical protein